MKRLAIVVALGAGLTLSAPVAVLAQPPALEAGGSVEPEAVQALQKMSAYLQTLNAFEITTKTSLDLVTQTGQRVQLDGTGSYKVRRPKGFVIEINTDWKKRVFLYDGTRFTVYAPELGYYAQVDAPATNLQTLDAIYEKFGIALPIEDLFRWNDVSSRRQDPLSSAIVVGERMIEGVPTDQYAFRQGDFDWQVWIARGDRPLPRKLVIVDRSDLAQPAYSAILTWTVNPTFTDEDFAFRPTSGATAIRLTPIQNRSQP
jgi:hypothetical protein